MMLSNGCQNISFMVFQAFPESLLMEAIFQLYYILLMWNILNTNLVNQFAFPYCQWPFYYQNSLPTVADEDKWNSVPKFQQSPNLIQKSYRETEEQIEQKTTSRPMKVRRKRIQKTRLIKKKEREDNFERKKQKKDRNLPSNICRYFISYLYHHPRPESLLQTKPKSGLKSIINSCISKVRTHIKDNQIYIRPALIESMCRTDLLGGEEARIFRIVFHRYLRNQFPLVVSMLKKLTKKEKFAYLKLAKKFVRQFLSSV